MSMYWRLRESSYYFTAIELKKRIPALKSLYTDEIERCLRGSNLLFYYTEKVKTPFWIRVTLIFCIPMVIILLLVSPLSYIITGRWGYKWPWFLNWMKALGF